ncbi:cytochrome P450 [Actinophytocola sp.]|uniref:cytochrome P450 n=1 Tax=Actinophytocola sp. TaxID=1872138 RepID=UPI00389A87C1
MQRLVKPVVRWGVTHGLPRAALLVAARRGDLQARLFVEGATTPTLRLTGLFDEVRAGGPLSRGAFGYLTASHAVVREVLGGNDFRTGIGPAAGVWGRLAQWSAAEYLHPMAPPSLLVTEPPDHTRYRKLVTRVFTVRAVENLRGRTEEIAHELLDALDPAGPVDLVEAYCGLLPVTVIAEILGVPPAQRQRVLTLGTAAAPSLDMGLPWRRFRRVHTALAAFDRWLGEHLEHLRAQPGDNLLSQLVAAREDGVGLTDLELRATAGLVLAAGFETTVNLLGNGIALLHDNPDQLAALRAEPSRWANAVEEVLRVDPPVLLTGRMSARDTEVAGVPVPAGALVTTILAGANHDPAVFADPDRFDVRRTNAREHIAFSAGRHYCLGAALARMEGEVGLRVLFDRFPNLRLTPGATHRDTRILRGYDRLPALLG